MDGVERLRAKRGHEQVTFDDVADHFEDFVRRRPEARATIEAFAVFLAFDDVADHFEDFVRRRPEARATIEAFAVFLAQVEDVDHEHEGHGPTLEST